MIISIIISLLCVFLIFQKPLTENNILSGYFSYVDEFSVAIFIFFFLLSLLFIGRMKKSVVKILIFLSLFFIYGVFSGIYNHNNLKITILGAADYIKNFFLIVPLSFVHLRKERIKSIYNILRDVGVFIGIISVVLVIRYLLELPEKSFIGEIAEIRLGLPRVSPFFIHPNMIGLYSILILCYEINIEKKLNLRHIFLFFNILFSLSRMVWISFFVLIIAKYLYNKVTFNKIAILGLSFIFIIPIVSIIFEKTKEEFVMDEKYYRGYVLKKSLEIWKDSPLVGFGPGTYGGVVSVKFNSPLYEKYNFSKKWYQYGLSRFHGLDTFWSQILVECGVLGTIIFIYFLFFLAKEAKELSMKINNNFIANLAKGLSLFPFVISIYLFGSGLNLAPILFPFSILYGLMFGAKKLTLLNYENSNS